MGLFTKHKQHESVALLAILDTKVEGALAYYREGEPPALYYVYDQLIASKARESEARATLRALADVAEHLVKEGGPALRHAVGSGHIHRIAVSVGAPWQDTRVRIERLEQARPFVFSEAVMEHALKRSVPIEPGRDVTGEKVIGATLNGYETPNPFGKRVNRAELVVLSSSIDSGLAHGIKNVLRSHFHTHAIELAGFGQVGHATLTGLYPHQKDFLALSVHETGSDIMVVKKGQLVDIRSCAKGLGELKACRVDDDHISLAERNKKFDAEVQAKEEAWLAGLKETLTAISTRHSLPRTVFLIAPDDARDFLKRFLDTPSFKGMWLSDESLTIVSLTPAQFSSAVVMRGEGKATLALGMLAFYAFTAGRRPS